MLLLLGKHGVNCGQLANKVNISRNYQTEMKLRQNMTELEHEEWSPKRKSYVKSSLPAEPKLNIQMCVDVPVYKQHRPPLTCLMTQYRNGVDQGKRKPGTAWNQGASFSTTADTGAQVNILGVNHIQKLGLKVNCLLKTKMVVVPMTHQVIFWEFFMRGLQPNTGRRGKRFC